MKKKNFKLLNTILVTLNMSTEMILFNFEPILLFIFLDEDAIFKISVCLLIVKFINSFSSIFLNANTLFGEIFDEDFEKYLDVNKNTESCETDDFMHEHLNSENMLGEDWKEEVVANNKKR